MADILRNASLDDMDLLYEWANEEAVRKNSFSSHHITYEEHKQWYTCLLADSSVRQYIYLSDGNPVGQIRINIEGKCAEIAYSICKEFRAMGYGRRLLELLVEKVRNEFPEIEVLRGKVKGKNIASQKVFQGIGFEKKYELYEFSVKEQL